MIQFEKMFSNRKDHSNCYNNCRDRPLKLYLKAAFHLIMWNLLHACFIGLLRKGFGGEGHQ